LTGFNFDMIKGNYQRRGLLLGGHALTNGIAGQAIGDGLGYGPQLYPSDGITLASAFTQQSQNSSALSVKEQVGWTSVFAATLPLPAGFWRNVAKLAKAHIWCDSDDVIVASQQIVAMHSVVPGDKIIHLPRRAKVINLITGNEVATDTQEIKFNMTTAGTFVYQLIDIKP